MLGRLVQRSDFERLLATKPWSRSAHFAVHHVPAAPASVRPVGGAAGTQLSTNPLNKLSPPVDELSGRHWLGTVLPKRLARRAVTRNLLRRQIRAAMERHRAGLPPGLWVVRLRGAFERSVFVSAASDALRRAAWAELDALLAPRATVGAPAGPRKP